MTRPSRPHLTLLGVRPSALVDLYRWRLKDHRIQELLAGMGIAVGVALFFGVLLANSSIEGSAEQLLHAVTGSARVELAARSSSGFDERLTREVRALPGVAVVAPILRESATVVGPKGRQPIQLLGVTPALVTLRTAAVKNLGAGTTLLAGGIGLPTAVANAIGAQPGESVTLLSGGDAHTAVVRAVLAGQIIGPVASSPIAIGLLPMVQTLTGLQGRITQMWIQPRAGADALVERELRHLAGGRLDVEPTSRELQLLNEASQPSSQSTTLFAAISAMVGFLLALNAMLLTVPERRRFVAELRTQGFGPSQVLLILASQAAMLGIVASIAGVGVGYLLSHTLFHSVPNYLTFAFPIGPYQVVHLTTVLLALGCGLLAALIASLPPMLDLRPGQAVDAVLHEAGEAGQGIGARAILVFAVAGGVLLAAVTVIVLAAPDLTLVGGILLALAALCLIPAVFAALAWAITPVSERISGSMLALAVVEFRATATRSIALAGVAALAVYGSVAIQGARHDLANGLNAAITQYLATADVWVTTGENVFTTDSFRANGAVAAIARAPGVSSVRVYQGGLLDVGNRRLWIRARPPTDPAMLQSSQLLRGGLVRATRLLRHGGWAAISQGFADERHLNVGDSFVLPTPSGLARFGVAAITTNVGWPAGAITLSSLDYQRYWQTREPAALEVNLKSGVTPAQGARSVRAALGPRPGLRVQTSAAREAQFRAEAGQAVQSLVEISTLLLVVAALAVAFALSAAIWQRRNRLSSLKSQGFDSRQLWRALLLESTIVLGIGCADGAALGVYGHALASRWLRLSTGFPAPFSLGVDRLLLTVMLLAGIALAVIAVPGLSAARVSASASFQE
ncbi:MAG TPA: FtsX-like permease family protein [Solirubrobacteraceae bacterium]|jgi:putative ABC transport system permease protein|nr:FtsX-like permease family protein [Solirubrobacteraceae bacterium]